MGEVYLAQDSRLHRHVALKVLPAKFVNNRDRLDRFEQEARAASALNHPNILTVYDIGESGHGYFIATEYIEGLTLRQLLAAERMEMSVVLDTAIQVASALGSAHQAGIVHRDIKPENIMRRPDGYIKVLDFGLAKLTEQHRPAISADAATLRMVQTESGIIMGTLTYMSPEQARGEEVDARSDIWSLGVVLYEMTTGRAPFGGGTMSDVIAAILKVEPRQLTDLIPEVPQELQRIVRKALRKDPEERYQTIKDMVLDLKNLKRELELKTELEYSAHSSSGGSSEDESKTTTKYVVSEIKRHKAIVIASGLVLAVAVVGIGYAVSISLRRNRVALGQLTSVRNMSINRLTTSGNVAISAVSPDGKYVAYATNDAGKQSLWVRHIATSSNIQIVAPVDADYSDWGMNFSPDGNFIYYTRGEKTNPGLGILYRVPVLGGAERKLIENVDRFGNFSPDGKQFVFVRQDPTKVESDLMIANVDGTDERSLYTVKAGTVFLSSAWSPDGRVIACLVGSHDSGRPTLGLEEIIVQSGERRTLTSGKWVEVSCLVWLNDGSGILLTAREQSSDPLQIWHCSYPGGDLRRITNDLSDYSRLSLTANSEALVAVQTDVTSNIWVAPEGDANRLFQITSGRTRRDALNGISFTMDGRILFGSLASGKQEIWIMKPDGSEQKQLTTEANNDFPAASPDGTYVVFCSDRSGVQNIWRMNIEGGNPKQLTFSESADIWPQISKDGRWVFFVNFLEGVKPSLWKVRVDGSLPEKQNDLQLYGPVIAPEGERIVAEYLDASGPSPVMKTVVISLKDGRLQSVFNTAWAPAIRRSLSPMAKWMPDGRQLAYVKTQNGVSNIWVQSLAGGTPRQLTKFSSDLILSFDWSRDGKLLALARGNHTNDVVLIKNFR